MQRTIQLIGYSFQVALLLLSLAFIAIPSMRSSNLKFAVSSAMFLCCATMLAKAWKMGLLGKSPEGAFEEFKGGRRVTTVLERVAILTGAIALIIPTI